MNNVKEPFLMGLWNRRFFQFFATYLGIGWVAIQLVDFLVKRYRIDEIWVDRMGIFLLLILPTIVAFIYNHGRPGHDEFKPFEKSFYPINILLAMIAPFLILDANASPSIKEIKVENELGDTITRKVLENAETKRIAIFPFTIASPTNKNDWWTDAIPFILKYDIEQNMRLAVENNSLLKNYVKELGYDKTEEIPLSAKLNISNNRYANYLVDGIIEGDENPVLNLNIYDVSKGKLIESKSFEINDFFTVSDEVSAYLQLRILGKPTEGNLGIVDLPVSNIISNNEEVIKLFIESDNEGLKDINANLKSIMNKMDQAVKLDPTCSLCLHELAKFKTLNGEDNKEILKEMISTLDTRPERLQLELKFSNYLQTNDFDKALKLSEMWRKLYPQDNKPYEYLISFYSQTFKLNEAIKVGEDALDNGIKGMMYVELAKLYANQNKFEKADSLIKIFEKEYPAKAKGNPLLADVYFTLGEFEKAKNIINEKLILDPYDIELQRKLINTSINMGDFDAVPNLILEALANCKDSKDSLQIYKTEFTYLSKTKQIEKAIEKENQVKAITFQMAPKPVYIQRLYENSDFFKENCSLEYYEEYLNQALEFMPTQAVFLEQVNDLVLTITKKDKQKFFDKKDEYAKIQRLAQGEVGDYLIEAYGSYLNEDYDSSLIHFSKYANETGTPLHKLGKLISEIYRLQSDKSAAQEYFESTLKYDPFNIDINLEYAKFLLSKNDKKKAKSVLEKIMKTGSKADDNVPAIVETKKLLENL